MMKKHSLLLLCILGTSVFMQSEAQDTLPKFTVRNVGNHRIIVSWINKYEKVKQISIQRSTDSLKNYRTILTVPDPMNRENGYVDTKALNDSMFYRLFIVLDGAMYTFSASKRPVWDTVKKINPVTAVVETEEERLRRALDPFSLEVNRPAKGMDSSGVVNGHDPKIKLNIFTPSMYVYTARDGNVHLNLPDVTTKKYWVKFFDENDNFLFEVRNLKESSLIVDKSNFYHAGWFKFELYIDEKIKEKHKFYLAKEF